MKAKNLVPARSLQCKGLTTATGPVSLPTPSPQSPCYSSSLMALLFCSLLIKTTTTTKTDTFYLLYIQSRKGPSIPPPNKHLKHMHSLRAHGGHNFIQSEKPYSKAVWLLSIVRACCLVAKLCLTLLQPHGLYSPPGSSVRGILQARILEWLAMPFSRGSSQPRD